MDSRGIFFLLLASLALGCKGRGDEKPVIERDNAQINYNIYGDGGATLLFIHGAFADQTYWDAQVEHFKEDYTVVTVDLPGHGKSGKGRKIWSVRGFADDIYTVIKRLNLKNVVLIGHSMGADVALMEATYRPKNIKGFVVIDAYKQAAKRPSKKQEKFAQSFFKELKLGFVKTQEDYVNNYLVSDSTPMAVRQKVSASFKDAYRPMAHEIYPQIFQLYEAQRNLMPELNFKLNLINVNNSPTDEAPLKKYAAKGYSLKQINGTSHYPMLENPSELNRILQQTLDEIAREAETGPAY